MFVWCRSLELYTALDVLACWRTQVMLIAGVRRGTQMRTREERLCTQLVQLCIVRIDRRVMEGGRG